MNELNNAQQQTDVNLDIPANLVRPATVTDGPDVVLEALDGETVTVQEPTDVD